MKRWRLLLPLLLALLMLCCAAEASGTDPDIYMHLDTPADGDDIYYYLGVPYGDGYYGSWNGALVRIYVNNLAELQAAYGGSPAWSVTQVSGPALNVTGQDNVDSMHPYGLVFNEYPTQPLNAVFRIDCSWGSKTATQMVNFHAMDLSGGLPANLDKPFQITGQQGQSVVLSLSNDLLGGWTPPIGDLYRMRLEMNSGVASMDGSYVPDEVTFNLNQAGFASGRLLMRAGTMRIYKEVQFVVPDANGNIPLPEINMIAEFPANGEDLYYYYGEVDPYASVEDYGYGYWSAHGFIRILVINEAEMRAATGAEPVWSVTQTSGPQLDFTGVKDIDSYHQFGVVLNTYPNQEMDATLLIKCNWGGKIAQKTMYFHSRCLTGKTPAVSLGTPVVISGQEGQSITLDLSDDLLGGWKSLGPDLEWWDLVESDPTLVELDWANDPGKMVVHFYKAGRSFGTLSIRMGMIFIDRLVQFEVRDANGNLPADSLGLEAVTPDKNFYIGMNSVAAPGDYPVGQASSSRLLTRLKLNNYVLYNGNFSGDPQWSVTHPQGTVNAKIDDTDPKQAVLYVDNLPAADEDDVYLVACDWGGVREEVRVTVHYKTPANGLPTGLEMDFYDYLIVRTGDILPLDERVHFANNWSIQGENPYEDAGAVLSNAGDAANDDIWTGVFVGWQNNRYADVPGIYRGRVAAFHKNVHFTEFFNLIITEADGTLPAANYPAPAGTFRLPNNTTTIESQAFAGLNMTAIDIPASVTFIADDAFQASRLCMVYCHNQYVADYAVAHGLAAMVD